MKIKTIQKGKFPVIGFVKDPTGVAALYLGKREGKDLLYMGRVGTGWSRSSQIRKQLDAVVSPKSRLSKSHGIFSIAPARLPTLRKLPNSSSGTSEVRS